MARKMSEARTRLIVGVFIIALSGLAFLSLFIIGQAEGSWKSRTIIRTDFRTITGLRKGSPVQLAGVEIGNVEAITFVTRRYQCDPVTEDVGRWGSGRTDNCDEFLFCSPSGECAELETYASRSMHAPCLSAEDCAEDEICVTKEFRQRARRVQWNGPEGVCARYSTQHRRVEVAMSVFEDKLEIVRTDSTATVASNGVLGDQLVNITPGSRRRLDELPPEERRIQSTPSLYEDIELFRERIDGLTNKVDDSLAGISSLFSELNDERTIAAVKGTIENVNEISRQIAEGQGMVGALISDAQYKRDTGEAIRAIRSTAEGADRFMDDANRSIRRIEKDLQPAIDDTRSVLTNVAQMLQALKDPSNQSVAHKLLYDKDGKWAREVEGALTNAKEITERGARIAKRIEDGEGTIGKLINDSKPHDDLVKILGNVERNNTWKRVIRYAIELDEARERRQAKSDGE